MTELRCQVRRGTYYDSLVLMQLQRALLDLPGVLDAGVIMATSANCELLAANNLLPDSVRTSPDDLLIVVKAEAAGEAEGALSQVDTLLARRRAAADQEFRPRSLSSALKLLPEAGWVLVSVPGRYAAGVAHEALDLGKHVFLYSDNVSLEDEIALKKVAREKGLLVMGPDCGTAIVNGLGLGFANHVRRGAIGLVGASGTGLQAITSRIHELGDGVSEAIGTGGRDLKAEVGGTTTLQALDLLARDPQTKVIVLVSKPPAAEVVTRILGAARQARKPVVVDFIGYPSPGRRIGNLHFATSLSEAAEIAVSQLSVTSDQSLVTNSETSAYVRGLFSGGTLAYEAMLGLQTILSPLYSNAPMTKAQTLAEPVHSVSHTILDLGGDEFTVGRLHPMIDNDLRIRRLRQEAADPEVGLILLDVVLGEGAHPDPAGELAPVIKEIGDLRPEIEVVLIVIGTEDDPQNLPSQVERFKEAGAVVFRGVNEAVSHIADRFGPQRDNILPVDLNGFVQPIAAINVGLESFYDSLDAQGAQAVHVDWRPPAGGDERMASLLARLKRPQTGD
jgi:FdrA protein